MTKLAPVAQTTQQLPAVAAKSARLKVAHILPDPNQPRKTFHQEKYDETKASIKAIGLQVPITVNPGPIRGGVQYYYIKYGENRWRIHVDLKWEEIDTVIDPMPYDGKMDIVRIITQAAENINRIDHTPSEIAAVYDLYEKQEKARNRRKDPADIQQDFATTFGKSLLWAQNHASIANLRPEFLARVDVKGPTQIPFMAAVALGKNPKERQPMVLHEAELTVGTRRDLLYQYLIQINRRFRKAAGEKMGREPVAGTKRALLNVPKNLHKAIDSVGNGVAPINRPTYLKDMLDDMTQAELKRMQASLQEVLCRLHDLDAEVKKRIQGETEVLGEAPTVSSVNLSSVWNYQQPRQEVTDNVTPTVRRHVGNQY